jgi:D-threo-aldose 1-dehydrogenase
MRRIVLPGTNLTVSRFAFGTASLFNVGGEKQRRDLLFSAYDAGFSHFDTAPYYGFGWAERDLKPLLAARPDVTVATKVGIYSPGGEEQSQAAVFLRKAAGRVIRAISRPTIDFSVARARAALSASLKRLGRERVELYLLHEADLALLDCDEWLRWLESEKDRVARFGLAVDNARLKSFLGAKTPLADFIQTLDSLDGREADALAADGRPMQITFGYVTAEKTAGGARSVPEVLTAALKRNAQGCVIVSTRKRERLESLAAIAEAADHAMAGSATPAPI